MKRSRRNKQEKEATFKRVLAKWLALHDKKGRDYDGLNKPYANARGCEAFGLPAWVGISIRMSDKMRRIETAARQYITSGAVSLSNETLEDSFDDIGVYSGIARVLLDEHVRTVAAPRRRRRRKK